MTDYRERQVVTPAKLEAAPPAARAVFDHALAVRGLDFLPNMFGVMGRSPGALKAVAAIGEHVRYHSKLDDDLREMVICEVSAILGNKYEWRRHIYAVPERLQNIVGSVAIEDEPAPIGPALRFARLLAAGDSVPDAMIDSLSESLGDQGLIDLTVMVGYYQLLATFCATLGIEVEDSVPEAAMPLVAA